MASSNKYSINWSRFEQTNGSDAGKDISAERLWSSIKAEVSQEYWDFPELVQFCALIESNMLSGDQSGEAKWQSLSLLQDLNDLLWAAELKRASSVG